MRLLIKKSLLFLLVIPFFMITGLVSAQPKFPMVYGLNYFPEHYSLYYNGTTTDFRITDDKILRDFERISKHFNAIRLHEFDPLNTERVLKAAQCYGMKTTVVGVAIDSKDRKFTEAQISGVKEMFLKNPKFFDTVTAIVLEDHAPVSRWSRPQSFFYFFNQFKELSKFVQKQNAQTLVGISADDSFFDTFTGKALLQMLPAQTPVFININPYLDGCSVNVATAQSAEEADSSCDPKYSFMSKWTRIENNRSLQKHQIIIGETGWPTDGQPSSLNGVKTSKGSIADAMQFFTFLYSDTSPIQSQKIPVFVFVAFDDPMDGVYGTSNNFWGVYESDSSTKYGMVYPPLKITAKSPKTCDIKIAD